MSIDLYWIPLGAGDRPGQRVVRASGRIYETLVAARHRRPRRPLFHAALVAEVPAGTVHVEMAPQPDDRGPQDRGVVAEGPVGVRALGRFRLFRYEVRRWTNGTIPDLAYAVDSPVRLTDDAVSTGRVLDTLPDVPTPVWGRDELGLGEMWNSNSVVAWALARCGLDAAAGRPPNGGRAPGWAAGLDIAHRATAPFVPGAR